MVAAFVVLTITMFVLVDLVIILVRRARGLPAREATIAEAILPEPLRRLAVPAGLFFDAGHSYIALSPSGRVTVGADDFVRKTLGKIDGIALPREGERVTRQTPIVRLKQGEREAKLFSPVNGVVRAVNRKLYERPDLISLDPYGAGWVCNVEPDNFGKDLKRFKIAEEAHQWFQAEVERFRDFIAGRPAWLPAVGQALGDGGEPSVGILEQMDDETWRVFADSFLRPTEE